MEKLQIERAWVDVLIFSTTISMKKKKNKGKLTTQGYETKKTKLLIEGFQSSLEEPQRVWLSKA